MISVSKKKWNNIQSDFRKAKKLSLDKKIHQKILDRQ